MTPADQILSAQYLKYKITFPYQNVIPRITQITFNGQIFCYGPSEQGTLLPTVKKSPNCLFLVTMSGVTNLWSNIVYRINQYTYNIQSGVKYPSQNSITPYNEPLRNPYIPQTTLPTTTKLPKIEESCGVANDIQTLVLKGEKTIENEYPWLVAMFHRQGVSYEFQCTANLITSRHVVTGKVARNFRSSYLHIKVGNY